MSGSECFTACSGVLKVSRTSWFTNPEQGGKPLPKKRWSLFIRSHPPLISISPLCRYDTARSPLSPLSLSVSVFGWVERALGRCTERHGFDSWSISTTLLANTHKDAALLFSLQKTRFPLREEKPSPDLRVCLPALPWKPSLPGSTMELHCLGSWDIW